MIIRHGHANAGASSEARSDRLSPLGRQQALWLSEHPRETGEVMRVDSETLNRQVDRAKARSGRNTKAILLSAPAFSQR